MAIKYKELKNKLSESKLSSDEKTIVASTEMWMDEQIKEKFDNCDIRFDDRIIGFDYDPTRDRFYVSIKRTRAKVMKQELLSRYNKAGWKTELEMGDFYGPLSSGLDYWVFKGEDNYQYEK